MASVLSCSAFCVSVCTCVLVKQEKNEYQGAHRVVPVVPRVAEARDERLQTLCVLFLHTSADVSIRQRRRQMSACRPSVSSSGAATRHVNSSLLRYYLGISSGLLRY